mmetsp:Transcript_67790/g.102238  ORF Transcript_67790/g.102238 Transcript_67790/m.102238 type:complete len:218 (+) Transcript_67790:462-1115(+)
MPFHGDILILDSRFEIRVTITHKQFRTGFDSFGSFEFPSMIRCKRSCRRWIVLLDVVSGSSTTTTSTRTDLITRHFIDDIDQRRHAINGRPHSTTKDVKQFDVSDVTFHTLKHARRPRIIVKYGREVVTLLVVVVVVVPMQFVQRNDDFTTIRRDDVTLSIFGISDEHAHTGTWDGAGCEVECAISLMLITILWIIWMRLLLLLMMRLILLVSCGER